ncbi:MAG: glycosyltransferase [Cyanobacteria bacterium P01_E01_bin.45]
MSTASTIPISIVMTVYNRDRFLATAIDSILAQSYPHFELILWDDGSSDRSVDIARSYAAQDSRIQLFEAEHLGRVPALARSTVKANGQFIGLVDSDDVLMPTALEKTVEILQKRPDIGMVYTNHAVLNEAGKTLGVGDRCKIPFSMENLLINFMTFHFRLIRTDTFWKVGGFDTRFKSSEDYDLCLKLSEVTTIYHLSEVLYGYRTHQQSMSRAGQLEQIKYTYSAISQALKRRGLNDKLELNLDLQAKYTIQKKTSAPLGASPVRAVTNRQSKP